MAAKIDHTCKKIIHYQINSVKGECFIIHIQVTERNTQRNKEITNLTLARKTTGLHITIFRLKRSGSNFEDHENQKISLTFHFKILEPL